MSVFGDFLVRIFPNSDWVWEDTENLSVFSPNAGKFRTEKLRIRTLFTQCWSVLSSCKKYLEMGIMFFSQMFLHWYTFKCKAKIRSNTRVWLTEFFSIYISNFIENKSRLASSLFVLFRPLSLFAYEFFISGWEKDHDDDPTKLYSHAQQLPGDKEK